MDFSDCQNLSDVILKQELLQWSSVFPEDLLLYHYTSPEGLKGILRNENLTFRFTRTDCLNDTTEGSNIIDYYQDVCQKLLAEEEIDNSFFRSIVGISPRSKLMFFHSPEYCEESNVMLYSGHSYSEYVSYVFCFSEEDDSLPMWNYYLKNGNYQGYNLGFNVPKLKERFHYRPGSLTYVSEFVIVEYEEFEKDDILKDFIRALFSFIHQDDEQLSTIKMAIANELFKWRYSFKSQYFSHEKEVRVLIHAPLNDDGKSLAPFIGEQLSYEPGNSIPKHIYATLDDKATLVEITTGPQFQDLESLEHELLQKGYKAKIKHSKIPVRY